MKSHNISWTAPVLVYQLKVGALEGYEVKSIDGFQCLHFEFFHLDEKNLVCSDLV